MYVGSVDERECDLGLLDKILHHTKDQGAIMPLLHVSLWPQNAWRQACSVVVLVLLVLATPSLFVHKLCPTI